MITRKKFIQSAFMGTAGLSITPGLLLAQDTKPQLPGELVKEFVGKSHSNKDRVIELHKEFPTLLNAAWDWGGGDFETGLGAASHVGLIDLVNYLVDNGAQMNFLTLCLWGNRIS
ncbi:MAG: hypothetical protein HC811_11115 [Flammeovirgaceae bacterium]|nr:hypothetical protein [Flammeovirgaceae bacterium]